MSNRDWLLIIVYTYTIGIWSQQVYNSLKLTGAANRLLLFYFSHLPSSILHLPFLSVLPQF